jgi:rare lipoprotein A
MRRVLTTALAVVLMAGLAAAQGPSTVSRDVPQSSKTKSQGIYQVGKASWYGKYFHGRPTASGEPYNMFELTAAHLQLKLGTLVRVTNLSNGRSVVVRINDRGPYPKGRIIDLSYGAAQLLGFRAKGLQEVKLEIVTPQIVAFAQAGAIAGRD